MSGTIERRDIFTILFKHKIIIVTVFAVTVTTAILIAILSPEIYESKATLLVKFGREYVYLPTLGDERGPSNYFNREGILNAEVEILTSRDLSEQVITSIGAENLYPALAASPPKNIPLMEAALLRFKDNLSVLGNDQADIIRVAFQHEDPIYAAESINQLVDLFQQKHLEIYGDSKEAEFLEKKVANYLGRLKRAQDALTVFQQEFSMFSIDEQRKLLLQQRTELNISLKNSQRHIVKLGKRLDSLMKQTHSHKNVGDSDVIQKVETKLLDLRLKEQDLLGKFKTGNELVANVKKEIRIVEDYLRTQKGRVDKDLTKEMINIKAELNAEQGNDTILRQQYGEVENELDAFVGMEREFKNQQRELETNEQNYRIYRKKLEEARISEEMDRQKLTNIRVIQAASIPVTPIWPRKRERVIVGLVVGALLGIGLALLREHLSQSIRNSESIEKHLGLSNLATFSYDTDLSPTTNRNVG